MLIVLLFVVALFDNASMTKLDVVDCSAPNAASILKVESPSCESTPCMVHHGETVTGEVTFVALGKAETLDCTLEADLPDVTAPWFCDTNDPCNEFTVGSCPIEFGEEVTYPFSMKILDSFPTFQEPIIGRWILNSESIDKYLCFEVEVQILPGKEKTIDEANTV